MGTQKRWSLLVIAGAMLLLLMVYPWFGCTVDRNEVQVSLKKRWVLFQEEGAAVGFVFNVTNNARCELHLITVRVTVHAATYRDGSSEVLDLAETQNTPTTISPGTTEVVHFGFETLFRSSPAKLVLRVEMSFREAGTIPVLEGELEMPYPGD